AWYFISSALLETAGLISGPPDVSVFGLLGCSVSGFTGISTWVDGVMALTSDGYVRNFRARFGGCNYLIVKTLLRCIGNGFVKTEPPPPHFTHPAPTHPSATHISSKGTLLLLHVAASATRPALFSCLLFALPSNRRPSNSTSTAAPRLRYSPQFPPSRIAARAPRET